MFICDKCNQVTAPRERCNFRVTEYRNKDYYHTVYRFIDGERKEVTKTTHGKEIVKELRLCTRCYNE